MDEASVLWTPPDRLISGSHLARYLAWLAANRGHLAEDYHGLWRWSVEDIDGFWHSIWDFFEVPASTQPRRILGDRTMPGAGWFQGATLNYAEMALNSADDRPAIAFEREDGSRGTLTRRELAASVGAVAAGLKGLGVERGDRVAAYLPNIPEAVIAFLATASLGAVWSACSPDFGAQAVIDRFQQIEPTVLIAVEDYRYGGRTYDRRDVLDRILGAIASATLVVVPSIGEGRSAPGRITWSDLLSHPTDLDLEPVPFDHPLWILYSSGTTGLPKAIVHGHGGILLEHLKSLALHLNIGEDSRFFWFTTTGWMMWNFLVAGLLLRATIVLYDGSPTFPDLGTLWRLAERTGVTYFGASAPFIHGSIKAGIEPHDVADIGSVEAIGSTGAPLSPEGFEWVHQHVGDVWLGSISGGTDLCTAVVGSSPLLPVRVGEIQCRCLGAKVEAFDPEGRSVIDAVGELVITEPMPSMPIGFWNDPDDRQYRASYFETYPGVWRHGDWLKVLPDGGCVISGRSDATLNRGGVRVGSAELYRVVESLPDVEASLVVDTSGSGDSVGADGELILFVVTTHKDALDDALRSTINEAIRSQLSPRHVPDRIVASPGIPTTLNGKRMEIPVKRLLQGEAPEHVASVDAVSDPDVFRWFVEFAQAQAPA
ncbi:MAG: acetoacetate--CoA ligase [Mycobacterium sp.]